jgi:hypothetical protein
VGNRRARELKLRQVEEAEWELVRTQPRSAYADAHARGIGLRRMQLIVAPSFEEVSVWEVRQGREWQLICPRVVETEPALRVVGHEVLSFPSDALAAYFERAASLTFPLRPDLSGHGGADGTVYEVAVFGDLYSEWRFRWWSEWPAQWRPLVELAVEMHAAFAAARGQEAEPGASADPPLSP